LHHHPGSDGSHHHLGGQQSHSDDHVHHQVAMKNGVTVAPPAHPPSMLNLWNSSGTTSNSGNNNNNNNSTEDITNDEAEDDNNDASANNHPSAGEINDLSHQAALSPSAIGSIKGKNQLYQQHDGNNTNISQYSILTKERKEYFFFLVLQSNYFVLPSLSLFSQLVVTVVVRCDPHPKKIVYVFQCVPGSKRESLSILFSLYTQHTWILLHLEESKDPFLSVHSPGPSLSLSHFFFVSLAGKYSR
jgi:hypothetical protein